MSNWICDSCGQTIEKAEDGWVEWVSLSLQGVNPSGRGLRLVHTNVSSPTDGPNRCQYNQDIEYEKDKGLIKDLPLTSFIGPDGLMRLLIFISQNELPNEEVLEMIKRLHIPEYEQARNYFKQAISEGVFEPNTPDNYHFQREIKATIKYISEHNE
jgi:hypothetical protein